MRFELTTLSLATRCSTTELRPHSKGVSIKKWFFFVNLSPEEPVSAFCFFEVIWNVLAAIQKKDQSRPSGLSPLLILGQPVNVCRDSMDGLERPRHEPLRERQKYFV
jgi:hypothetical protein